MDKKDLIDFVASYYGENMNIHHEVKEEVLTRHNNGDKAHCRKHHKITIDLDTDVFHGEPIKISLRD